MGKKYKTNAPGLPVPTHERRSVTFKNTPEIHVMTPDCTPPVHGRAVWADPRSGTIQYPDWTFPSTPSSTNNAASSSDLSAATFTFPIVPPIDVSPSPPCRIRVPGPYDSLSPASTAGVTDAADPSSSSPTPPPPTTPRLSLYGRLKAAAKALKREVLAVYYAMQHPRTPLLAKIIAGLVIAYALSPLDLIPDFIPVLGLLDDLLLLPLMIAAAIALLPRDVLAEARQQAEQEPLRLGRSWGVAVVIAAMWIGGLEAVTYWGVRRYGNEEMQRWLPYGMLGLGLVCSLVFAVWLVGRVRKERRKQRKGARKEGSGGKAEEAVGVVAVDAHAVEVGAEGGECGELRQPLLAGGASGGGEV